jgi:hypothetical protein
MTDDLVPVDDERVTTFRRLLAQSDAWRASHDTRNDAQAISEDAAAIVGGLRDTLMGAGLADVIHNRFKTEALETSVDPEWSNEAAADRRSLMGVARVLYDLGGAMLPGPYAAIMAGDCALRAQGDPPIVGSHIPGHNRRVERPAALDHTKAQIARLAHYNAGWKRTNWAAEHALIYPGIGNDARREWNRALSAQERGDCWRVGKCVRAGAPLTSVDVAIRHQATQYDAEELRRRLKSTRASWVSRKGSSSRPPNGSRIRPRSPTMNSTRTIWA